MLNFYDWCTAAGYDKELPYDSKKYFADKGKNGTSIAQNIQNTASADPLIVTAPNHLRIPMLNPYIFDWGQHLNVSLPQTMSDPDTTAQLGYGHSMFRHEYYDVHKEEKPIQDFKSKLILSKYNPLYTKYRDNVQEFKEILETVTTGPFKRYGYGKIISQWLCDTFMVVTKDSTSHRFSNMGYFAIAMSNGATFDLNKIKALISKMNPERDGVPNSIPAIKAYIENSDLYKELSKTNKYLALSSALHQQWNKSDQSRSELYTNPNSKYLTFLRDIATNRNSASKESDTQFMHSISELFYNNLNTTDSNKFMTPKEEQRLLQICKRHLEQISSSSI